MQGEATLADVVGRAGCSQTDPFLVTTHQILCEEGGEGKYDKEVTIGVEVALFEAVDRLQDGKGKVHTFHILQKAIDLLPFREDCSVRGDSEKTEEVILYCAIVQKRRTLLINGSLLRGERI